MANKKITLETLDTRFTKLESLIERGFAAIASDMATKEDLTAAEKRLDNRIDGAIVKINGVQNTLDAQALVRADQQLPERVSAIEKHLGISKNIAA